MEVLSADRYEVPMETCWIHVIRFPLGEACSKCDAELMSLLEASIALSKGDGAVMAYVFGDEDEWVATDREIAAIRDPKGIEFVA
jgi:hypothetical protein